MTICLTSKCIGICLGSELGVLETKERLLVKKLVDWAVEGFVVSPRVAAGWGGTLWDQSCSDWQPTLPCA